MRAIVRPVSSRFADALTSEPLARPLDVQLARRQHAAYVEALRAYNFEILALDALDDHPDACFVEDTAVVIDGRAFLTRPGHPSRRGEVDSMERMLMGLLPTHRMQQGSLDGGDVLCIGRRIYVGRSLRTDDAGIAELARCFPEHTVIPVSLRAGLHLKSGVTALPDGRVLVAEERVDPSHFSESTIVVDSDEADACNVVSAVLSGEAVILAAAGFPKTAASLAREGFAVHLVDNSELRRADSALTCLSVLIP